MKHGEEGSHSACKEQSDKYGGKVQCCTCTNHKCKGDKSQSGQDDCKHKFDFGLGGKGIKTSRHCGKCDQWEDIPNEKKS